MLEELSQEDVTEYANNALTIQEPQGTDYTQGAKVGKTIPAKWWNWLFNAATKRLGQSKTDAQGILSELQNTVTDAGIELDSSDSTQLSQAVAAKANTQIADYVTNKLGFTNKWHLASVTGLLPHPEVGTGGESKYWKLEQLQEVNGLYFAVNSTKDYVDGQYVYTNCMAVSSDLLNWTITPAPAALNLPNFQLGVIAYGTTWSILMVAYDDTNAAYYGMGGNGTSWWPINEMSPWVGPKNEAMPVITVFNTPAGVISRNVSTVIWNSHQSIYQQAILSSIGDSWSYTYHYVSNTPGNKQGLVQQPAYATDADGLHYTFLGAAYLKEGNSSFSTVYAWAGYSTGYFNNFASAFNLRTDGRIIATNVQTGETIIIKCDSSASGCTATLCIGWTLQKVIEGIALVAVAGTDALAVSYDGETIAGYLPAGVQADDIVVLTNTFYYVSRGATPTLYSSTDLLTWDSVSALPTDNLANPVLRPLPITGMLSYGNYCSADVGNSWVRTVCDDLNNTPASISDLPLEHTADYLGIAQDIQWADNYVSSAIVYTNKIGINRVSNYTLYLR